MNEFLQKRNNDNQNRPISAAVMKSGSFKFNRQLKSAKYDQFPSISNKTKNNFITDLQKSRSISKNVEKV